MGALSSSIVDAGTLTFVTQTIYNVTITASNTEFAQTLPTQIIGYEIKTRDREELILSHDLSGTGSTFWTIKGLASYENLHNFENLVLYFQSPSTSAIVEIIAWQNK